MLLWHNDNSWLTFVENAADLMPYRRSRALLAISVYQVVQVEISSEIMERGASHIQLMLLTKFHRVRVGVVDTLVAHDYRAHLNGLRRRTLIPSIVHSFL